MILAPLISCIKGVIFLGVFFMRIKLYKVYDEENKLNKTLNSELVLTGSLKTKVSVFNPIIMLKSVNFNFLEYNYCFIEDFNRYYFIEDIEINALTLFEIRLREDVLMSFNSDIKNMTVQISESSNPNSNFIDCKMSDKKELIQSIDLENPFSQTGFLYMSTIKGV